MIFKNIAMKAFKKLVLKKQLKKIGKGALTFVDNAALGGAVTKTIQDTKESPAGQIPYLEITASLVPVILLIAVLAGWVSIEEVKELLKLF